MRYNFLLFLLSTIILTATLVFTNVSGSLNETENITSVNATSLSNMTNLHPPMILANQSSNDTGFPIIPPASLEDYSFENREIP
jgi:hypothetical protein